MTTKEFIKSLLHPLLSGTVRAVETDIGEEAGTVDYVVMLENGETFRLNVKKLHLHKPFVIMD